MSCVPWQTLGDPQSSSTRSIIADYCIDVPSVFAGSSCSILAMDDCDDEYMASRDALCLPRKRSSAPANDKLGLLILSIR